MKNVIITGPTGAIGTALIEKCISEGTYVTAVCHKGSKRIKDIPRSEFVSIVECDLDELHELPKMVKNTVAEINGIDAFYHLGWACTFGDSRNNVEAQSNNIRYTVDAVEVAAKLGCKRFIGAGSQAEYGRTDEKLSADTPCNPENGYGIAKLCAGQLSRIRASQLGIEHIWTRILSVYGPHDGENTLISMLIRKLSNGEHISCSGGDQIWDYLYSEDAANALYLIGDKGLPGSIYPLGSGQARPLKEYIEIVKDSIDPDAKIGFGEVPYGPLQVMHLEADISKLQEDTGFKPVVSFEEGIYKCRTMKN